MSRALKTTSPSRPFPQRQARTVFLRVPSSVWALVSTGRVGEFRAAAGNASQLWKVPLPTLAVVYRRQPSRLTASYRREHSPGRLDYRLMTLEAVRQEALGAITDEGLAAAGYSGEDAFARFRRDWTINEKKRFEPLRVVFVYTVHPVKEGDLELAGRAIIDHLYGDHIAQEAQTRPRTLQTERGSVQGARGGGEAVAGRSR